MNHFLNKSSCTCNVYYGMSLIFVIGSNIFIFFLILNNSFNIYWGPKEMTVRFIFWLMAEIIILMLAHCLCIIDHGLEDESEKHALLN